VVFRSHGGSDAAENVVALCTDCHLRLLHHRLIQLEHADGKLRWVIGANAGLVVVGRELVANGEAPGNETGKDPSATETGKDPSATETAAGRSPH
jgi:hypothetical protein